MLNRIFIRDNAKLLDAVCPLKQATEVKFDFKIDGILHINWFRRKKDEYMEELKVSTKK